MQLFLCLKMFGLLLLLFSSFVVSFVICNVETAEVINNKSIPAVFMFGDSVVDTGNNNFIKTTVRVDYLPYGEDFMGGRPTGRFSNGKVPSDLLVEELGIKPLLPPYLDPSLTDEDLITGVNFASGASGYDPMSSEIVSVLSLSDQLNLFKDSVTKLKGIVGEAKANMILNKSLFVLVAGSNDITNTYFGLPIRRSHYNISSYTNLMLTFGSNFMQELYQLGARRIGVFGLPPIGCVPSQRTLKGGMLRECSEYYNGVAQMFNNKLIAELNSLNSKYPDARMVYLDSFSIVLDLIYKPQKYGFKISDRGCCGTGMIEVQKLCKIPCLNVEDFVFWDSFHPTEKAYRFLVSQTLKQYLKSFF